MIDKIIEELEENAFEVDTRDYGRLDVVDIECAIEIVKKYENDVSYKYNLVFQKASSDGGYWGNDGWKDVTIYANSEQEAICKAKELTNCNYIRALKVVVTEPLPQPYKGEL